ncbi:kelch-like protein 10 [Salminus brasiliensis]|uniref:kelch-like protein 10 n=1 Tax=Salminus brasiliensis TaxID=930266 RepID=UPI003B832CB1
MSSTAGEISKQLRLDGKLCDVVLRVGGAEVKAHKIILCSCSGYFRVLFTSSHWKCSEKSVFTIPDVSPDIMELILQYAYSADVDITSENVQDLLAAANQLDVLGLVGLCCNFLEKQLCPENCIGICRFADWYSCRELYRRAHTYILHHFEEVVREPEEEFLELTLLQLSDILEKDELNAKREETVFEAVLKWIEHAPTLRSSCIVVLLPKVRLGLMDNNYFLNNVRNNPLVSSHLECQALITRVLRTLHHICRNGLTCTCFLDPVSRPRLPYSILLAVGGWSGNNPTNAIEAYDSRTDRWMLIPWAEESPRAYHGTAFLDGALYIIGGFNGVEYFNSVQKFNPITHSWSQAGPMHFCRCYVSATVLDGYVYAMGGFTGYERLNSAERYEPKTNQWSLLPPMHEKRSDASAATLNGKVYICGGFTGSECLFTAECFDPQTNQWTLIAPMQTSRSGLGVVAFNQRVFAIGGFDGVNRLHSAEAYNPNTDSWSALSAMFHPRSNFGIEVLDDRLYVAGGFNGLTTISSSEYYEETSDEWFDIQDMHVYRSALSCCVVSGLPNVTEYTFHQPALQLQNKNLTEFNHTFKFKFISRALLTTHVTKQLHRDLSLSPN